MKRFGRFVLALGLVLSVVSPSLARVATIQTSAPLDNHSEASVKTAISEAVKTAVRGAVAMGLTRVELNQAVVLPNAVVIQILASDTEADDDEQRGDQPGERAPDERPAEPTRRSAEPTL